MKLSNEQMTELAQRSYKTDAVSESQLAKLETHITQMMAFQMGENGLTEEAAETQVLADIEEGIRSRNAGSGGDMRALHYEWIKEVCATKKPGATVSAPEVYEHAKSKHGYKALDAKGIGDSMGRGCGKGLYLEPADLGGHKKAYRVPDPEKYADWYQSHDAVLPRGYYSDGYWKKLITLEAANPKSKFFQQRTAKATTA